MIPRDSKKKDEPQTHLTPEADEEAKKIIKGEEAVKEVFKLKRDDLVVTLRDLESEVSTLIFSAEVRKMKGVAAKTLQPPIDNSDLTKIKESIDRYEQKHKELKAEYHAIEYYFPETKISSDLYDIKELLSVLNNIYGQAKSIQSKYEQQEEVKFVNNFQETRNNLMKFIVDNAIQDMSPNMRDAIRPIIETKVSQLMPHDYQHTTYVDLQKISTDDNTYKTINGEIKKFIDRLSAFKQAIPLMLQEQKKLDDEFKNVLNEDFSEEKEKKLESCRKKFSDFYSKEFFSPFYNFETLLSPSEKSDFKHLEDYGRETTPELDAAFTRLVLDTAKSLSAMSTEAFVRLKAQHKHDPSITPAVENAIKETLAKQAFETARDNFNRMLGGRKQTTEVLGELRDGISKLIDQAKSTVDTNVQNVFAQTVSARPVSDIKTTPTTEPASTLERKSPPPAAHGIIETVRFKPEKVETILKSLSHDKETWQIKKEDKAPYVVTDGSRAFHLYSDKLETKNNDEKTFIAMLNTYKGTHGKQLPVITAPPNAIEAWKKACETVGYSKDDISKVLCVTTPTPAASTAPPRADADSMPAPPPASPRP